MAFSGLSEVTLSMATTPQLIRFARWLGVADAARRPRIMLEALVLARLRCDAEGAEA